MRGTLSDVYCIFLYTVAYHNYLNNIQEVFVLCTLITLITNANFSYVLSMTHNLILMMVAYHWV